MRSPEAARTGAVALLLVAVVLFAALAAWSLAVRSTIPMALDGAVTGIEIRQEKHPGVDDVWLVAIDGEQRLPTPRSPKRSPSAITSRRSVGTPAWR
jgi:hypothetical protein